MLWPKEGLPKALFGLVVFAAHVDSSRRAEEAAEIGGRETHEKEFGKEAEREREGGKERER